jgi:hypothetical protein
LIVSVAVFVVPLAEAEMLTVPLEAVGAVDTVKVVVDCPAGTLTFAGTVACEGFELSSGTTRPPLGAGAESVMVPVDEASRTTVDGFRPSEATVGGGGGGGGVTVSTAVLLVPLSEAVMPTTCVAVTADVVIVNEADEEPRSDRLAGRNTSSREGHSATAGGARCGQQ